MHFLQTRHACHYECFDKLYIAPSQASSPASRIFHHLSGHQLSSACSLAQHTGDHRLALCMAQVSGAETVRGLARKQLHMWHQAQVCCTLTVKLVLRDH